MEASTPLECLVKTSSLIAASTWGHTAQSTAPEPWCRLVKITLKTKKCFVFRITFSACSKAQAKRRGGIGSAALSLLHSHCFVMFEWSGPSPFNVLVCVVFTHPPYAASFYRCFIWFLASPIEVVPACWHTFTRRGSSPAMWTRGLGCRCCSTNMSGLD